MTTTKKIKVTLSDASPVSIDPEQWPIIASAERHDGKVACQANTEWEIKVREHADGRRLVYGSKVAGNGGQYLGFRQVEAGYLIGKPGLPFANESDHQRDEKTIRAIRRVAGAIDDDDLGVECIGDLPAQEI
jgi:hypothetical protein